MAALFVKLCNMKNKCLSSFTFLTQEGRNEIKIGKRERKGKKGTTDDDTKEIVTV
jgi:hypothetical protein